MLYNCKTFKMENGQSAFFWRSTFIKSIMYNEFRCVCLPLQSGLHVLAQLECCPVKNLSLQSGLQVLARFSCKEKKFDITITRQKQGSACNYESHNDLVSCIPQLSCRDRVTIWLAPAGQQLKTQNSWLRYCTSILWVYVYV